MENYLIFDKEKLEALWKEFGSLDYQPLTSLVAASESEPLTISFGNNNSVFLNRISCG